MTHAPAVATLTTNEPIQPITWKDMLFWILSPLFALMLLGALVIVFLGCGRKR